jgi:D-3-phosphoglycerate dehydrogenase
VSEKFVVIAADKISLSGLTPLTEDDRFEVLVPDGWTPEEMQEALGRAHGLIVRSATMVTRELLDRAPNLKVVGRAGVGVDNIDLDVATELGVPVINAPEGNTVSAAELAMALILNVARNVSWADASVRGGAWDRSQFSGIEIRGKVLGLVGAGRIGSEVALRAQAFGMDTIAYDPYLTEEHAGDLGIERVELANVIACGDVISLHVPLTPQTEGMIGEAELRAMKPSVILINAARGGVVDEGALVAALESGEIAAAALDVYATEPLPEDSPLRGTKNLVLTPHLGASTAEAQESVAREIAQGVRAALLEGDLSQALNAPAIGGEDLEFLRPLMDLAVRVGRVAGVLGRGRGGMNRVSISVAGLNDDILGPLTAAAMTGVLTPVMGARNVNYVNALHLAEGRAIELTTTLQPPREDYAKFLEIVLETEDQKVRVAGALLGEQHHPRIVQIDGYELMVQPEGCLIVLRNNDVPGVIGRVGTLLAAHGLNIAEYIQSREAKGGLALAAVSVDGRVSPEFLATVSEDEDILDARAVYFDG